MTSIFRGGRGGEPPLQMAPFVGAAGGWPAPKNVPLQMAPFVGVAGGEPPLQMDF